MEEEKKKKKIKILSIVIRVMLVIDLILTLTLILVKDKRREDETGFSQYNFEVVTDDDFFYLQLVVAVFDAVAGLLALLLFLAGLRGHRMHYYVSTVFLKSFEIFLAIIGLPHPDSTRLGFLIVLIFFRIAEIIVLLIFNGIIYQQMDNRVDVEKSVLDSVNKSRKVEALEQGITQTQNFHMISKVRSHYFSKFKRGITFFSLFSFFILFFAIMTGIFEFKKIVSTESPMFSQNNVDSIHNDANPESTIGKTRLHSENKVVVVIFDGVRWDYMQTNKELMALLQNNSFVQDSKMFRMETSLPSMSVPNWLTIITGSQPELTGVLGNLMIPETHFDSMFNEAKNYNLSRVITASPWFGNIVKSTLPYLGGDATIATNVGAEDIDRATADPADYLRGSVAIQAIQQNYNLVLLHMSDVDIQGHAYGVDPKFNKDDSYNKALTNKTKILQSIIDELDNDTVLFWLSDHGQVDRGGHGGTDPTEMNVPLVIYKKNSNFHSMNVPSGRPRFREKVSSDYDGPEIDMSNFPQFEWPVVSNIDVAPTICALLGIPVPRTSPGWFVDEALLLIENASNVDIHYSDIYLQKRAFTKKFLEVGIATSAKDDLDSNCISKQETITSPAEQVNCVHDFADYYDNNKKSTVRLYTFRNVILDLLIESLFVIGLIYIMSRYTFSDFKSIFKKPRLIFLNYRRSNVIAFLFSLIAVMVYFLISILLFFGLERGYGYKRWESTLVHAPVVIPIYMSYIIIPSTIMEYLVIRLYHGPYLIFKKFETNGSKMDKFKTLLINIRIALFSATRVRDVKMIYLIKIYLLFWTVISIFFLFLMMSGFTFILPLIFRIHFISKSTWGYHFRILTVLFISYPLIIGQLIQMATWPKFSPNTAFFDTLFQVGIQKDAIKGKKKQEQIDSKIDFTILDRNHTNQFAKNENFADIFFSNPNTIYSSVSNKLVHTITDHLVNEKNEINDEALLNEDKFQDLHFDSQDSSQREREFEDIKENDTDDK